MERDELEREMIFMRMSYRSKRLLGMALAVAMVISLSGCSGAGKREKENAGGNEGVAQSGALTWIARDRNGYDRFWELLNETYPDIEIEKIGYNGANPTGYSWEVMKGNDVPDLFSTSQILDKELAKERLLDLSSYDFLNELSTSVLDQVSIDGGVYLLPVNDNMYGILYNKTLMEEMGWELPQNYNELEDLCNEIKEAGLIPGILSTQLTGNSFSAMMNLAKTDWLTTTEGSVWEKNFLAGNAAAAGKWETTAEYAMKYTDMGMFSVDPEDRAYTELIEYYLAGRRAVFFTMASLIDDNVLSNGDKLGMMPYIGEDGSKNIYMYNPTSYIGISKALGEPGNEEKLEKAVKVLSLMFTSEGQAAFITEDNPCAMSVLASYEVPEDSLVADAALAMREGRAFPMTYAGWENVLSDMGQAFKDMFRGENDTDIPRAIERMDELQRDYLDNRESTLFCESTGNFTLEQTARLTGLMLTDIMETDAAMIPYGSAYKDGAMPGGVSWKLYKGPINVTVANTLAPFNYSEVNVMTMTGGDIKALAEKGFEHGLGEKYPYVTVTKEGAELEDGISYRVAFLADSFTEETGEAYNAVSESVNLLTEIAGWLKERGEVSVEEVRG